MEVGQAESGQLWSIQREGVSRSAVGGSEGFQVWQRQFGAFVYILCAQVQLFHLLKVAQDSQGKSYNRSYETMIEVS